MIPNAVAEAWDAITNHPLWKVAETLFWLTPAGITITGAEVAMNMMNGADSVQEAITNTSIAKNYSGVMINNDTKIDVGGIHTQKLDEEQAEEIISTAVRRSNDKIYKNIDREFRTVI